MCPYTFPQWFWGDAHLTTAVSCQVFLEQMTWGLTHHFQPQSCIVIFAHIFYLYKAYLLSVIHYRQTPWPAAHKHGKLSNFLYTRNVNAQVFAIFAHFSILVVRKRVSVLRHEVQLVLELLRQPEVVGVEKGYPPALGSAQGIVAGDGSPTVLRVARILYARVFLHIGAHHLGGVVGGAVVLYEQFPSWGSSVPAHSLWTQQCMLHTPKWA